MRPLCLALLLSAAAAPLAAAGDAVAPELRAALAGAPGARVPAYLVMKDQLGLDEVQLRTRGLRRQALSREVVKLLKAHADESQAAVRAVLDEAVAQGGASEVQQLWVGNALIFSADAATIARLAALPGVDRVQRQGTAEIAEIHDGVGGAALPVAPAGVQAALSPEPNLTALQAPALWSLGFNGSGILIANIDTGTWWTHPDLVHRVWTNPGEIAGNGVDDDGNGFKDDIHGWDFTTNTADVTSSDPHGTNTAGILVGDGGGGSKLTGMAPGATMIVLQMSTEQNYWLCQQYAMAAGVDVISSSNSFKWNFSPKPDYHLDRQICDMELAAGIIHANSIGNQGNLTSIYPIPFNIATPGNCPTPFAHPHEQSGGRSAIMGCGGLTSPGDVLYTDSGKGPAAWEDIKLYFAGYPWAQDTNYWDYPRGGFAGTGAGLLKPDVMTYTNVQTTTIGNGYSIFGGTSAATPHLGGAMCLLRDVQPQAEPRHIAAALQLTALDMGTPGKDNLYGCGKMRCLSAARRLLLLARFDSQLAGLGDALTLDLFGPASEPTYAFLAPTIVDDATDWNLKAPFLPIGLFLLDGSGHLAVPLTVPVDNALVGLTIWLQLGAHNHVPGWGGGVLLSVPESVTISS
jgi:subtilisin family serine protease